VTRLCDAADLRQGRAVIARLSQTASVILLRKADGDMTGYRNACPHMGIELNWDAARLLTPSGRHLRCSAHDARFEIETGLCVIGPCRGEFLTRVPVRVCHGEVVLDA
jgi:nitrite reductase/ring-hydroxylating ferredoxin subunit